MTDEAKLATGGAGDDTRWLTAERTFDLHRERQTSGARPATVIIPTPKLVQMLPGAPLDLRRGARLRLDGVDREAIEPALAALARAGVAGWTRGPELQIKVGSTLGLAPEGYRLAASGADKRDIRIEAADSAGASHALRSLEQQVAADGGLLRPVRIDDAPRFGFRGLHVDVARNFHGKEQLLKLVEQMSAYKLNRLHLHLADDEGWRLEIKALPELTDVGAFRCHDLKEDRCLLPQLGAGPDRQSPVNGFLSQEDYREILRFAAERHIEVIPSLDMPGHSRAAIRSMEARYRRLMAAGLAAEAERFRLVEPQDRTQYRSIQYYNDNTLNVCIDSTYRFLDLVLDELAALHASAGTPLKTYHIGADETAGAWSQSPACKRVMASTGRTAPQLGAMFIERVSASLAQRGIKVGGWSDGLSHVDPKRMPPRVHTNIWSDLLTGAPAEAHRHANLGWDAVISVPNILYFDTPYAPHPLERGYDWPSRGTDAFKAFRLIPENLPANASVMRDRSNKGLSVTDKEPLAPGRRFAGIQAQLWSETVRSDAQVDYMLFPRLLAVAERAWHQAAWEPAYRPGTSYSYGDGKVDRTALLSDWQMFAAKLPAHLARLDKAGIHYRVSPPGARIVAGRLEANSEHPGQRIEYRSGAGQWLPYGGPVRVRGPVQLRTRSADGRRTSRMVTVGR
jgi:hexosaminidase